MAERTPLVGIIMGSESDLAKMQGAADILKEFDIPFEGRVISAHRAPHMMADYAETARDRGIQVIIAGAGGAAHLPGTLASLTPLPIIGVPISSRHLQGLDSLLSIVQMPSGVPVATLSIDGSKNAGLLAVQIIALSRADVMAQLVAYKGQLLEKVKEMDQRVYAHFKSV
jgi:5-(carboxyamino)imidazole ribonucleotide mutase